MVERVAEWNQCYKTGKGIGIYCQGKFKGDSW